ncbi:hypothetical protein VIGAN_11155000, partial [Vigna angularis var. angularis]
MTCLRVALNAFPLATISTVVVVSPCRQHVMSIYEVMFEVKECLSLPVNALYFCGIVESENGFCSRQQEEEKYTTEF